MDEMRSEEQTGAETGGAVVAGATDPPLFLRITCLSLTDSWETKSDLLIDPRSCKQVEGADL